MRSTIATLLLTATPCWATSFPPPSGPRELYSANRAFVLVEDLRSPDVAIYNAADRSRPVWTYTWPEWHAAVWLSDDGEVVVTTPSGWIWEQKVPEVEGIVFRNRAGVFRQYPLRDICPDPPRLKDVESGPTPIGDFWRSWSAGERVEGNELVVRTTRGWEFRFRLPDGELMGRQRVGWRAWGKWVLAAVVLVVAIAGVVWASRRGQRRTTAEPLSSPPDLSKNESPLSG